MYTPHVITLINVSQNQDESLFYNATILDNVFLDPGKSTSSERNGMSDRDSATLFIPFSTVGRDGTGAAKEYIPPKAYDKLSDKRGYWTLKDGGDSSAVECYFIKGEVNNEVFNGTLADVAVADLCVVDDTETPHDVFEYESYEDMVREYDYVYAVTTVLLRDFGRKSMQHFQVGAR